MKWHNYLLSALCMAIMLLLIYFRSGIESWFASQFQSVKEFSAEKYPINFHSIANLWNQKYKWAFTISFTTLFSLASLGCVWFLFPFKVVFRNMIFIFISIFGLIILFSIFSLISHRYDLGFGVVHYLKKLLHSAYLTLFLILYYWKINNPFAPKKI